MSNNAANSRYEDRALSGGTGQTLAERGAAVAEELDKHREAAERELHEALVEINLRFVKNTSLTINAVSVEMMNVATIDEERSRFIVGPIRVYPAEFGGAR